MPITGPHLVFSSNFKLWSEFKQGHIAYDPVGNRYWMAVGNTGSSTIIDLYYSEDKGQTWTKDTSRTVNIGTDISGDCVIACSSNGLLTMSCQGGGNNTQLRLTLNTEPGNGWTTTKTDIALGIINVISLVVVDDPDVVGGWIVHLEYSSGSDFISSQAFDVSAIGAISNQGSVGLNGRLYQQPGIKGGDYYIYRFDNFESGLGAEGKFTFTEINLRNRTTQRVLALNSPANTSRRHCDSICDEVNNKVYGIGFSQATLGLGDPIWYFLRADIPGLVNIVSLTAPTGSPNGTARYPILSKVSSDSILLAVVDYADIDLYYNIYSISGDSWSGWTMLTTALDSPFGIIKWPYEPGFTLFLVENETGANPDLAYAIGFSFNQTPNVPTNLQVTSDVLDTTPVFSADISDPDSGQDIKGRFQVYESDGVSLVGTVDSSFRSGAGTVTAEFASTLAAGEYNVQAATVDDVGEVSDYTEQVTFFVKVSVTEDTQFLWDVDTLITEDIQFSWDVLVANTKDLQLVWNVKAAAESDLQLVWSTYPTWTLVDPDLQAPVTWDPVVTV